MMMMMMMDIRGNTISQDVITLNLISHQWMLGRVEK